MKGTRQFAGTLLLLFGVGACGDPLLPSDFTGPPSGAVNGVVVVDDPAVAPAAKPQLSLQWLSTTENSVNRLVSQPLTFARAVSIESDWSIDLARPEQSLQTERAAEPNGIRMLVGKIVYFDDADGDGSLSWSCESSSCDRAVAFGEEFVVYVIDPVFCRDTSDSTHNRIDAPLLSAGYHYFRYRGNSPDEIDGSQPMRFLVESTPDLSTDTLTGNLEIFASRLARKLSLSSLGGCSSSQTML
jgi:hypothetical protein